MDLTARKVVHTLAAETTNNITSLAVADGWLYVAEGNRYGSQPGRLTRIYIVPNDPRFLDLKQGQQITLPSAGHGFWDLAVSGGRYLAVTAPAQSIRYGAGHLGTDTPGKVYVLDLAGEALLTGGATREVSLQSVPGGQNAGRAPQYVTSAGQSGEFLLTNAMSGPQGFVSIHFDLGAGGTLGTRPRVQGVNLFPAGAWFSGKYLQTIHRTHGVAYTQVDGIEYALVADYNLPALSETPIGKQVGGKLAVIQDPFGRAGGPRYLGATTPIPFASLDKLALSDDGRSLYATAFLDEPGAPGSGIYSTMYQTLFVWDAEALIRAAAQAGSNAQPIDRSGTTPIAAAQPLRYDGASAGARCSQ